MRNNLNQPIVNGKGHILLLNIKADNFPVSGYSKGALYVDENDNLYFTAELYPLKEYMERNGFVDYIFI